MSSQTKLARPPEVGRAYTLYLSLGIAVLALIAAVLRMQPPAPKGVDAPPDVFSAQRALHILRDLLAGGLVVAAGLATAIWTI